MRIFRRLLQQRHIAFYMELPFFVLVDDARRVVVPPRRDGEHAYLPVVRLRFHSAPGHPVLVPDAALEVALSQAPHAGRARARVAAQVDHFERQAKEAEDLPRTVVELTTAVGRADQTSEGSLRLFLYCLDALNRFLRTYVVATEDSAVHPLTIESAGPMVICERRRRRARPSGRLSLPNHHAPLPGIPAEPADDPDRLALLPSAMMGELSEHPLDRVRQWKARGGRLADEGDYDGAVVALQTSAEGLIFAVRRFLLIEDGLVASEVDKGLDVSFSQAVKDLQHPLGGNWDRKGSGVLGQYWRRLYGTRNRIAHAG